MATFWERAAHLVDHNLCSLCILTICNFSYCISCFGFKGRIWVLIAPVPGHCILVTYSNDKAVMLIVLFQHFFRQKLLNELRREKTGFLHMRKQRRR